MTVLSYSSLKQDVCQLLKSTRQQSKPPQRHLPAAIAAIQNKRIYVCVTKDSVQNEEYHSFLHDLVTLRQTGNGLLAPRIFALLFDGIETVGLRGYIPVKVGKKDENPDKFVKFLEDLDRKRIQCVQSIVNKDSSGKFLPYYPCF